MVSIVGYISLATATACLYLLHRMGATNNKEKDGRDIIKIGKPTKGNSFSPSPFYINEYYGNLKSHFGRDLGYSHHQQIKLLIYHDLGLLRWVRAPRDLIDENIVEYAKITLKSLANKVNPNMEVKHLLEAVYELVDDLIKYDKSYSGKVMSPFEIVREGRGVCMHFTSLAIALLKILRPDLNLYYVVVKDIEDGGLHAVLGVEDEGKVVLYDPQLNLDGQYKLTRYRLEKYIDV